MGDASGEIHTVETRVSTGRCKAEDVAIDALHPPHCIVGTAYTSVTLSLVVQPLKITVHLHYVPCNIHFG